MDLGVFARNCPVEDARCPSIVGIKFGEFERGCVPKRKAKGGEDNTDASSTGNRFKHQVRCEKRKHAAALLMLLCRPRQEGGHHHADM